MIVHSKNENRRRTVAKYLLLALVNLAIVYVYDITPSIGVPNVLLYESVIFGGIFGVIFVLIRLKRQVWKHVMSLLASFAVIWGGLASGDALNTIIAIVNLGILSPRLILSAVLFVGIVAFVLWVIDFAQQFPKRLETRKSKQNLKKARF